MYSGLARCYTCSLHDFCGNSSKACPAFVLDGKYFVELKVEKQEEVEIMAATDYEIVEGLMGGLYLAKKTLGITMSEDRRPITEDEIIGSFEHYLREWCKGHKGDDTLFIRGKNGKLLFKATLLDKEEDK